MSCGQAVGRAAAINGSDGAMRRLALAAAFALAALPCAASGIWDFHETYDVRPGAVFDVGHDIGGKIEERAALIHAMQEAGVTLRFTGECYSSCTMMVAVPEACATRTAMFAFHGPSHFGEPLAPPDFAYFVDLMTRHYPEPLKSWFLAHSVNDHVRLMWLSGAHMIANGVLREC